jgi:hypothetical protein
MIIDLFEEKLKNLEYPITFRQVTEIHSKKKRFRSIDAQCNYIIPLLSESGRKQFLFELKDEAKLEKMFTEIHMFYKFAILNFSIDKPEKGDILAKNPLYTFNIEIYQPDVSRSKYLREIERRAIIREYESVQGLETKRSRSWSAPINPEHLLREIVVESIKKKRSRAQLAKDDECVNILCVDLSDRSLAEKLQLTEDLDVLKYFDVSYFNTLLDEWKALNGLILSKWTNDLLTDKIGILINRDLEKDHISILNNVMTLLRVI